jgi:hypothetical protein
MSNESFEFYVKISFCTYDKQDLTVSISDIRSDKNHSYLEYSQFLDEINSFDFNLSNVEGITTREECFDVEDDFTYSGEGVVTLEFETSYSMDGTEHDSYCYLKVNQYKKEEKISELNFIAQRKFEGCHINVIDEKLDQQLEIKRISENLFFVEVHSNCLRRRRILKLEEFCEYFEVYLDYKNIDEVKNMLMILLMVN